jgi:glucose/arabinose dehydrogenase
MPKNSSCPLPLLPEASLRQGFCAQQIGGPDIQYNQVRSLVSVPNTTHVLLLERGTSSITLLTESTKHTIATTPGLNHGLALYDNYIYASTATTVFRWPYDGKTMANAGTGEAVIVGMNSDGKGGAPQGHKSRTLAFDVQGRLYVSIGSAGNVDSDSFRARIRRFDIADPSKYPMEFTDGLVFADGLRNTVGLAFDAHQMLWGVDTGADNLVRSDLGGDIHNDNPGEELNSFPEANVGKHYGYPYCWSEYLLDKQYAKGAGTRRAWPHTKPPELKGQETTDAFCNNDTVKSDLSMQAHSTPLGIVFYQWKKMEKGCTGSFPKEYDGYAFIAFHGSWNRSPSTGYKVVFVKMTPEGKVKGGAVDLMAHEGTKTKWTDGFRPVDLDFDRCGRLLVSSDGTRPFYEGSKVIRLSYDNTTTTAIKTNNKTTYDNTTYDNTTYDNTTYDNTTYDNTTYDTTTTIKTDVGLEWIVLMVVVVVVVGVVLLTVVVCRCRRWACFANRGCAGKCCGSKVGIGEGGGRDKEAEMNGFYLVASQ